MTKKNASPTPQVHHRVRTFFAAIFGTIALLLVFVSVLVVWANRTLTDTAVFVDTTAPLVTQPAVQTLIINKATDQLLKSGPVEDMASTLLTPAETTGKTDAQLTDALRPVISDSLKQVLSSAQFATLWKATLQSQHAHFLAQLNDNSSTITLNLGPAVTGAVDQLKQTKLAPVADKLNLESDAPTVSINADKIDKVHMIYKLLQQALPIAVGLTLLMIALCVWVSVHHVHTIRRILFGSGLIGLALAAVVQATSVVKVGKLDADTQAAATAIVHTLFHNLQVACLIFGGVCIILALGSKIYEGMHKA